MILPGRTEIIFKTISALIAGIFLFFAFTTLAFAANSSADIFVANLDEDPKSDLVIDFGPQFGIWGYYNNTDRIHISAITPKSIVIGNIDADPAGRDDLIIDFGTEYGIWGWYNNTTWTQISTLTAESITETDIDGNGIKDIIIDFGPEYGIWINYNNLGPNGWRQLHNINPKSITTGDLDGNGKDDIIVDFDAQYGIWCWYNDTEWRQISTFTANSIIVANIDANPINDLIVDFGPVYGIWCWYNNATWVQISTYTCESITIADMDANGANDLVIDFGDLGIWIWYNNQTWQQLHYVSAKSITAANLDSDSKKDLIVDFGPQYGIWIYYNNQTWWQLHTISPCFIIASDMTDNGQDEIIVDFGPRYGVWIYYDNSFWNRLHYLSPWALNLPPPEFIKLTGKTAVIGTLLQFKLEASDLNIPEGELTYTATNLPPNATFDAASRTFSWMPTLNDKGTYEVTFTVSNQATSSSQTVIVSTVYIEEARLTNVASVVDKPAIYKDRIVWSDNRNSTHNLYMYDIASRTESPVTASPAGGTNLGIYGNWIVYAGQSSITLHNISTSENLTMVDIDNIGSGPVIYKDRVVWIEENPQGVTDPAQICIYDIQKGTLTSLSDTSSGHGSLNIYEDTLFWETTQRDLNLSFTNIWAYDLISGIKSEVLNIIFGREFAIYGDKIAMPGPVLPQGLAIYNISTEEWVSLVTTSNPRHPAMYENMLVWGGSDGQIHLMTMTFSPRIISATGENTPDGYKITITGTNFGYSQPSVEFDGGIAGTVKSWSDTSIICLVSSGALTTGDHILKVSTAGGKSNGVKVTVPGMLNAPTILSVTGVSATKVDLVWQYNSGDEDGFKVETSDDGGLTYHCMGSVEKGRTAYSAINLGSRKTYYFKVYAYTAKTCSAYSNIANATTLSLAKPVINPVSSPTTESVQTLSGTKDACTSVCMSGLEKVPADDFTIWSVSIMLVEGQNRINVTTKDSTGVESDPALVNILLDTTPPTTPIVTDDGATTKVPDTLHAVWASQDLDTGIAEYQYAIGTAPGVTDVINWTSCGTQTEVTKNGLNLISGKTYYFSVRAENTVGLWSLAGSSDGITVVQTAPSITNIAPNEGSVSEIGDTVSFNINATDIEGDTIQYKVVVDGNTVSDWNDSPTFNWDTSSQVPGSKQTVIYVKDVWGNESSRNIELYVARRALDMPQVLR